MTDDPLVGCLCPLVNIELSFQNVLLAWVDKDSELCNQILAFARSNKSGRLHGVNQKLNLCGIKMPSADMILILHLALGDDVHAKLNKLRDVFFQRP